MNEREKSERDNEAILNHRECTDNVVFIEDKSNDLGHHRTREFSFNLDKVYYETSTQRQFYDQTIREHVQQFVTMTRDTNIITYGQTSSGKTYTIDGDFYTKSCDTDVESDENLGIMPRILYELCIRYGTQLRVSYYEIYCEKIFDLLAGNVTSSKECRFSENNGQITMDVIRYENKDAEGDGKRYYEHLKQMLREANKNRHFGFTAMNSKSSRSHTFLELHCPVSTTVKRPSRNNKVLRIIDLAGSERPSKTLAKDKVLSEGININNSLMYLKQMIEIIANQTNRALPKFRESKLTRIIHSSINGNNAQVVLILCCSPSVFNFNETLNTLRFGSKAIQIERKINNVLDSTEEEEEKRKNMETIDQLLREERTNAIQRLHDLEATLTRTQQEEKRKFELRVKEYEEQIKSLKESVNTRITSMQTYQQCRETIELQRRIIDELTKEKIQMRNELNIYQLFREYMVAAIEDEWNEEAEENEQIHERMSHALKLLKKY